MYSLEEIIIRPLLTEKSNQSSEKQNKYSFQVKVKANKYQIKSAIEKLFDVKVVNVNTAVMPGKMKRVGRRVVKSKPTKKAHIQLKSGQKIELFKGI